MKTVRTTLIVMATVLVVVFIGYKAYWAYHAHLENVADQEQLEYRDELKKAATPTKH